jgi:hypothetical protein
VVSTEINASEVTEEVANALPESTTTVEVNETDTVNPDILPENVSVGTDEDSDSRSEPEEVIGNSITPPEQTATATSVPEGAQDTLEKQIGGVSSKSESLVAVGNSRGGGDVVIKVVSKPADKYIVRDAKSNPQTGEVTVEGMGRQFCYDTASQAAAAIKKEIEYVIASTSSSEIKKEITTRKERRPNKHKRPKEVAGDDFVIDNDVISALKLRNVEADTINKSQELSKVVIEVYNERFKRLRDSDYTKHDRTSEELKARERFKTILQSSQLTDGIECFTDHRVQQI